jgi:hypothetical protein
MDDRRKKSEEELHKAIKKMKEKDLNAHKRIQEKIKKHLESVKEAD